MTREKKAAIIRSLAKDISEHAHFYVLDAMGMRMQEVEAWRRLCRSSGFRYKVAKNTLIKKALASQQAGDYAPLMGEVLENFSGLLFSSAGGTDGAKALLHFHKDKGVSLPRFKAARVDGALYVGAAHLAMLAARKSKEELMGDIIGALQSPMGRVLRAVGGEKVLGLLRALAEKKEE